MSYSYLRTCTVVLLYCAVLFAQISVTFSTRDSKLSRTRPVRDKTYPVVNRLYKNHPILQHAMLSDEMRSLLIDLKRKKRVSHHGRMNKMQKTARVIHSNQVTERTKEPPLININDIESPIAREKHDEQQLLLNNDITFERQNIDAVPIVRRSAVKDSTTMTNSVEEHTVYKRQVQGISTLVQIPIVVTEIIELLEATATNKPGTLQRREVSTEPETTCITVTGIHDNETTLSECPLNLTDTTANGTIVTETTANGTIVTETTANGTIVTDTIANGTMVTETTVNTTIITETTANTTIITETSECPLNLTDTAINGTTVSGMESNYTDTSTITPSMRTPRVMTAVSAVAAETAAPSAPAAAYAATATVSYIVETAPPAAASSNISGLAFETKPNETCDSSLPCHMSDTLSEILQSVESLADQKTTALEDFPCQVNGSWVSEAGGIQLDIAVNNNDLEIVCGEAVQKKRKPDGFLRNATWLLTGTIPIDKKSMIIINAVNHDENKVATFIGECKGYSPYIQIIWGHWIVGKSSDCNDESIFSQRMFVDALEKLTNLSMAANTTGATGIDNGSATITAVPNGFTTSINPITLPTNATTKNGDLSTIVNGGTTTAVSGTGVDNSSAVETTSCTSTGTTKNGYVSTMVNGGTTTAISGAIVDSSSAAGTSSSTTSGATPPASVVNVRDIAVPSGPYSLPPDVLFKLNIVQQNINDLVGIRDTEIPYTVAATSRPSTKKKPIYTDNPYTLSSDLISRLAIVDQKLKAMNVRCIERSAPEKTLLNISTSSLGLAGQLNF